MANILKAGVPIAAILGVPMYGSCAAIAALSLPEAIMLRRAMKLQLIVLFFGVTTLSIIAIGYLFNLLQGVFL